MRNRGRHRRLQGAGPPSGTPPGQQILTITDDTGIAVATTAAPHGLTSADDSRIITLSGTSVPAYNTSGEFTYVTATTFNFGALYTEDATGGTWEIE